MFYVIDGSVYFERADGKYVNVSITGKDKVVEIRELESVTVTEGTVVIDSIGDAIPCTLNTIVAKFNVSEKNPVPFVEAPAETKKKKPAAKKASKKAVPDEEDF